MEEKALTFPASSSRAEDVAQSLGCPATGDAIINDPASGDKRSAINEIVIAGREDPGSDGFSNNSSPVISTRRFWLLSFGVCLGLFLSLVDSSIVATSLYSIGADFQTVEKVNWVALAYTLAYVGCAVTFANLSDLIGMHDAFLVAYAIFFIFSMACGFASSLTQLIAFRALQGIGGSGLYSLSMIILTDICPKDSRASVGIMIGITIACSGVLGPALGGILTHFARPRLLLRYPSKRLMKCSGPIGFVSLSICLTTWPKGGHFGMKRRSSRPGFDFVGSALVIASSGLIVFAFQKAGESPNGRVWGEAIFIAPLAAGLFSLTALLTWEFRVEKRSGDSFSPAFPLRLFQNRTYRAGAVSTLLLGYPYLLIMYSFPLRAQVVSQKTALMAGFMLLPMLGMSAVGSVISSKINNKRNFFRETLLAGACCMTVGTALLTTVSGAQDDKKALGFLSFSGLGFGLSAAAATNLVIDEASDSDQAPAHGILALLRIFGGSLGISTSTILVHTEARKYLVGILTEEERAAKGRLGNKLSEFQWKAIRHVHTSAFSRGMVAASTVSGAAVLLALIAVRPRKKSSGRERRTDDSNGADARNC
ncbi:hypothetical protein L249_4913 [Ophiocordyceps polyrhachis-furcata BCC 54312]|uniref:Major facilitator superfamily (MFS) profile domain-containing protein n=1 Tax=Ophiocordyceps polyrhachis-furcata BCC 54312 TaxID=1330021 RepID=A0A367L3M8_9HYPO|nr:hypothetical protein L249_4913 [Ophiocordyceps polyrhachis-furcata BCC 54312]